MKAIICTILFLVMAFACQAQVFNLRSVVRPGTQLVYSVEAGGKTYDFIVTVLDLSGKAFSWKMSSPVNKSGTITHTTKGLQSGDALFNYFSDGNTILDDRTTSVWLSQKLFKHFQASAGKPINVYPNGVAQPAIEMGTFTGSIPLEVLVDGQSQNIDAELVKPLKKSGKEYIPGGDESMHYYGDKTFPIILGMRFDFFIRLREVRTK